MNTNIVKSQTKFWDQIDSYIVNRLLHLFDMTSNNTVNNNNKLIYYIENERKLHGLDSSGVVVNTSIYIPDNNTVADLYLNIYKNNKLFVYLTIHLHVSSLNSKHAGPIHIKKEIYKIEQQINKYSRIRIIIPEYKQNSLQFLMEPGYNTTEDIYTNNHDYELKQEIDVIISVLNKLFDEDNKEYYIGNNKDIMNIHKNTPNVLTKIDILPTAKTIKPSQTQKYKSSITQQPIVMKPIVKRKNIETSILPLYPSNINLGQIKRRSYSLKQKNYSTHKRRTYKNKQR